LNELKSATQTKTPKQPERHAVEEDKCPLLLKADIENRPESGFFNMLGWEAKFRR